MSTPRLIARALTGVVIVSAIAVPTAGAHPITIDPARDYPSTPTDQPTVTRTIDAGVDLGSAAIGAGGASAVLLLTAAGAAAALHHRRRISILD